MSYTIYCHINKINGKRYIGQTSKDVKKRWRNGKGYTTSPYFNKAINEYGWQNFDHAILEEDLSEEEVDDRERYWISYYHTWIKDPECNGYNLDSGGNNNKHHSDETKEKMRQSALGRKMSDEAKAKMSEIRKKENLSEGTRKKMSESAKNRIWDEDVIKRRTESIIKTSGHKVVCIETGEIYPTTASAARAINYSSPSHIGSVCKGKRKTAGGYHWKYFEDLE